MIEAHEVEEVSLGDFVLTGGLIAEQALIDATVRAFFLEKSGAEGETATARRAHLTHFIDFADYSAQRMILGDGPELMAQIETEFDNLEDALVFAEGQAEPVNLLRLRTALTGCYEIWGSTNMACVGLTPLWRRMRTNGQQSWTIVMSRFPTSYFQRYERPLVYRNQKFGPHLGQRRA